MLDYISEKGLPIENIILFDSHGKLLIFYISTVSSTGGCGSGGGGDNSKVDVVIDGVVSSDREDKKQVSRHSASSRSSQLRGQ